MRGAPQVVPAGGTLDRRMEGKKGFADAGLTRALEEALTWGVRAASLEEAQGS